MNFVKFKINVFVICASVFVSNQAFSGTILMITDFFNGKLNLSIDGKFLYSGQQKIEEIQNGGTLEKVIIEIDNVPIGTYSFHVQFQDQTSPEYERFQHTAEGNLSFSFSACSGISIGPSNPDSIYSLVSAPGVLGSFELRGMFDKSFSILVGPIIDKIVCNSADTAQATLDFYRKIFAMDAMKDGAVVLKEIHLQWSDLKEAVGVLIKLISSMRVSMLSKLMVLTGPEAKITYTQQASQRLGPSGFDCSGLIYTIYKSIGLNIPLLTVAELAASSYFLEVQAESIQKGDLIVHLKSDDPSIRSNHVGIFTGKSSDGNVLEISATTRGGNAELEPDDPDFKNSIIERKASVFGKKWRIYRWANSE